MMIRHVAGAAVVLLATTAAAQQQPAQPGPIVVTGKKVCETILKTGSILPKRICKTQAEWDEERAATLRTLERWSSDQDIYRTTQMRKDLRQDNKQ